MPKAISPALKAHLAEEVTTITSLWHITRQDGVEFFFTELDQDLVYPAGGGGDLYLSASGYSRTAIGNELGYAVTNVDVAGAFDNDAIKETDLRAGLFNGAEVMVSMVNWADLTQGAVIMQRGEFGQAELSKQGIFKIELRGLSAKLQQVIGKYYQAECRADLGGPECKVPLVPGDVARSTAYAVGDYVTSPDTVPPAPAFVQKINSGDAQWAGGGHTSISATFGAPVGAHGAVVGHVTYDISANTIDRIIDEQGNEYPHDDYPLTGDNQGHAVFTLGDINNAPTTISVLFTGSGCSFTYLQLAEYANVIHAADPRDGHEGQTQSAPGSGANAVVSGAGVTPSQAGDLAVGVYLDDTGSDASFAAGTGFTSRDSATDGSNVILGLEDKVVGDTSTTAARFTVATGSGHYSTALVLLKAAPDAFSGTPSQSWRNRIFRCTTAGTTDSAAQVYDYTVGHSTTDGTAVFVAMEAWTRTGVVAAGAQTTIGDHKHFNVTLTEARDVDGWFTDGAITFETGDNAGATIEVRAWAQTGAIVTLFLKAPFLPAAGDVFYIWPGCNHDIKTGCRDKFDNVLNFRGEPYVPGQTVLTAYASGGVI